MDFEIEKFTNMIRKMAWICYKKLSGLSMYTIQDLIQEGYIGVLSRLKYYKPEKSSPSTFVYMSLKSHYSNIMKKENRFTDDLWDGEFMDGWYKAKACFSPHHILTFKRDIQALSNPSYKAVEAVLTMPAGLFTLIRRDARYKAFTSVSGQIKKVKINKETLRIFLGANKKQMSGISSEVKSLFKVC